MRRWSSELLGAPSGRRGAERELGSSRDKDKEKTGKEERRDKKGDKRPQRQMVKIESIVPGSAKNSRGKGIQPLLALKRISESPGSLAVRSGLLTERAAGSTKLTPREKPCSQPSKVGHLNNANSASGASLAFSVRSPVSTAAPVEFPKKSTPSTDKRPRAAETIEVPPEAEKQGDRQALSSSNRTKSRHVR